jgi:hypothetical protein
MSGLATTTGRSQLPERIADAVDEAMRESRTSAGQVYPPFIELPGIRDSEAFQKCVRRLLILYVDLCVFQDEWRDKNPLGNKIPDKDYIPDPFVNYFAIRRDLVVLNMIALKILQSFSEVNNRYTSSRLWKENLLGAIICVALAAKTRVTGIAKIKSNESKTIAPDIPGDVTRNWAVRYNLQSCGRTDNTSLAGQDIIVSLANQIFELIMTPADSSVMVKD